MRSPRWSALEVGGLTPLSTTDWPGKLAAVVFVQGCPWRCAYCHNPELQVRWASDGRAWRRVLEKLERRVGLLDGVVFSGGEPTLDTRLPEAIASVRALGFRVGLHTAGIYPERLSAVLGSVDWVGFDVKTDFADYPALTGTPRSGDAARRALALLLASDAAHELRTTYHPALIGDAKLLALARTLKALGATSWVLQQWRAPLAGGVAQARPIPTASGETADDVASRTAEAVAAVVVEAVAVGETIGGTLEALPAGAASPGGVLAPRSAGAAIRAHAPVRVQAPATVAGWHWPCGDLLARLRAEGPGEIVLR
jgi:pyruvate formate lyase activating enzyme